MRQIRVLIVEDEGLYRQMLQIALQSAAGVKVVGVACDGESALRAVQDLRPDVMLTDIELGPGMHGVDLGRRARQIHAAMGVVLLSNHHARQYLQAIPAEAAAGWCYLLKRSVSDLEVLVRAIQGSSLGLVVLDPQISSGVRPRRGSSVGRLTPRQFEVLGLLAEGYSNAAIAERLFLSEKSVENYLTAIYRELGIGMQGEPIHPRVKAVLTYLRETQDAGAIVSLQL